MKRYRLRKEIKISIMMLLILFIIYILSIIVNKLDNDFIESCTKAGYTLQHCERVK